MTVIRFLSVFAIAVAASLATAHAEAPERAARVAAALAPAEEPGMAERRAAAHRYAELVAYDHLVRPTAVVVGDEVVAALKMARPGLSEGEAATIGADVVNAMEIEMDGVVRDLVAEVTMAHFTADEIRTLVEIYETHFVGPVREKYGDYTIALNRALAVYIADAMPRALGAAMVDPGAEGRI